MTLVVVSSWAYNTQLKSIYYISLLNYYHIELFTLNFMAVRREKKKTVTSDFSNSGSYAKLKWHDRLVQRANENSRSEVICLLY